MLAEVDVEPIEPIESKWTLIYYFYNVVHSSL